MTSIYGLPNRLTVDILVIVLVIGVAITIWHRYRATRRSRLSIAAYPGLARINRWTLVLRYAGIVLGLLTLPIAAVAGHFDMGTVMLPAVMGCTVEACLIAGELICFRDARQPGVAALELRQPGRYLPAKPIAALGSAIVVFAAVMGWCWHLSAPDGQTFAVSVVNLPASLGPCGFFGGPFFGPHYSVPIGIGLLVTLVLTGVGLAVVARRPRNGADPVLAAWDDGLRRRSARAMLATATAAVGASLAVAGVAMSNGYSLASQFASNWATSCGLQDQLGVGTYIYAPAYGVFFEPITGAICVLVVVAGILLALWGAILLLGDFAPKPPRKCTVPASPAWCAPTTALTTPPQADAPAPAATEGVAS